MCVMSAPRISPTETNPSISRRSSRRSGALKTLFSASLASASLTVHEGVSTSTSSGGASSGRPTCRAARNSRSEVVASRERIAPMSLVRGESVFSYFFSDGSDGPSGEDILPSKREARAS